ncbi:cytochrome c biogenesis protein CCS1, chloroplastic-like isoform X2 [Solanum pennellii]|uniref:Cytochrome c biogenesis protein CCS1, chloroplastic-like isoform X2 n=1 Tax=Solanum pennellii TaxID=28526 RepID=A0ABM1GGV6_SOLPN|nr:cytochrome c biogenesis protein CCS1, chloroplastic-like isoform X2 [Solanum pennellii]
METLKFSIKPPHLHNHLFVPQNSRIYSKKGATFSFTLTCKFNPSSKGMKISKKKKISNWPDSGVALPLLERNNGIRELLKGLLNLPLAIGETFAVAALMALGSSVVGQGEVQEFVYQNIPENHPLFSLFSSKWITLGLDHMFSSPIFIGTLGLLGASLMACTYTTQTPLVKVARRRSFLNSAEEIHKQDDADTPPRASVKDSGVTQMGAGYEVFVKGPTLHALKGLADRIASIGVHLALLLAMSGGTLDAAGTLGEAVTVPQGLNPVVEDVLTPSGVLSSPSDDASSTDIHVNRFYVDYDESGEEVLRKTVSTGVRRPNSKLPIEIDGSKTVIADAIGSHNSDLKTDSEAPIVYASLGSLMLSTCISYLSHAQISVFQDGITEAVRDKTNRDKGESSDTVDHSLDQVPEVFESSCTEESDSFIGIRMQVGIWNKKDFDM